MKRPRFFFLSTACVLAVFVACGGSGSTDNGNSQQQEQRETAHKFYVDRVHAQVGSCIACHDGTRADRFLASEAEASYTALERAAGMISAPANSPLLTHQHTDPAIQLTPDQRSLITQWLSLEANARSLAGAVQQPKTITDAYQKFADCMNINVWNAYRMGDLPFTQTDDEGPCLGCHSTGQGSAWLAADPALTFEKAKVFPFIEKYVVGKLDDKGSFESLQPSLRFESKANEVCPPGSTSCHPSFGLAPNVIASIDGFVNTTLQNLETGTCENSIVVLPTEAGPADAGDGG